MVWSSIVYAQNKVGVNTISCHLPGATTCFKQDSKEQRHILSRIPALFSSEAGCAHGVLADKFRFQCIVQIATNELVMSDKTPPID